MSDQQVRLAAFDFLRQLVDRHGEVLKRELLAHGFDHAGERVPLLGPQGIFKPRACMFPISITTTSGGHYPDAFDADGLLRYRYRGEDPYHHENVGLRTAWRERIPLIYFHSIIKGEYLAFWPVFIVGDNPERLAFRVAVDDPSIAFKTLDQDSSGSLIRDSAVTEGRRRYITANVRMRLHQRVFRERVLQAYRHRCTLCRLRHRELLEAAHIIPDVEPEGEPKMTNGLALCKLHHAAFDRMFLGIRPDYVVEVRREILEEEDGPMLIHGLKDLHEARIELPRSVSHRPDPDLLERRFERFRAVS